MLVRGFHLIVAVLLFVALGGVLDAEPVTTPLRINSGEVRFDPGDEEIWWDVSGDSFSLFMDGGVRLPLPAPFRAPYDPSHSYEAPAFLTLVRFPSGELELSDVTVQAVFSAPPQSLPPIDPISAATFNFPSVVSASMSGRDVRTSELFKFSLEGQGQARIRGRVSNERFTAISGFGPLKTLPLRSLNPGPSCSLQPAEL